MWTILDKEFDKLLEFSKCNDLIWLEFQYYQFKFLLFGCVCIYIYVYIHLKVKKLVYYISYNNDGNNDMLVEI